ncbi:peptide-methionine (S)-S-oxide reductase MsrA [Pararhizobium sp. PWRC1-1]|uniref:peptide-methionine (S)-S-oxide reductase MsrA n=1 Tax=Pararhizobium sp. PWRC1-1 TaxID=2804566 RepID=UPI003CE8DDC8
MNATSNPFKGIGGVRGAMIVGGLFVLLGASVLGNTSSAAEEPRLVPPPLYALTKPVNGIQTAVFAGGCFWGVQGVFQHVEGVINATSGYAGGSAETATYELTETGNTGHAEAVRVVFDPQKISYGKLLRIYFSAAHDPTQLNRQGPDIGSQYRSAIFPIDDEQERVAAAYIEQLEAADVFGPEITTTIEVAKPFYRAESYHQDFMANNPSHPYIAYYEEPKVQTLKAFFPELYREKAVLVSDARG